MAKEIFRYTIHRVGVKRALQKGEIRKKTLAQAVKALQRRIRKTVCKQHIQLYMKVWNAGDTTEKFAKQYDDKKDFRTFRKTPKWRAAISRKVKYSRTFSPEPKYWFVAVGKRGQIDLTKLSHDPTKKTLLKKKRKRLFGPFDDEAAAAAFRDRILQKLDERRKTVDVQQHRRYVGV